MACARFDLGCKPAAGWDAGWALCLLAADVVPEAFAAARACFFGLGGLLLVVFSASAEGRASNFTAEPQARISSRAHAAPSHGLFRFQRRCPSFNAKASSARSGAQRKSVQKTEGPTEVWHCNHPRLRVAMPGPVGPFQVTEVYRPQRSFRPAGSSRAGGPGKPHPGHSSGWTPRGRNPPRC